VQQLAQGEFIERYENIIILGNPGTGKTHLSIALAREWCLLGRKVYFTQASHLVQQLLEAKAALRLTQWIKKLDHFDVLLIDDISYVPYDRPETDVLFNLLSARYETRSTVVTSNLPFAKWDSIFKDEMTTAAAVDRLVHHSVILELNTESYRISQAKKQGKKGPPMEPTARKPSVARGSEKAVDKTHTATEDALSQDDRHVTSPSSSQSEERLHKK